MISEESMNRSLANDLANQDGHFFSSVDYVHEALPLGSRFADPIWDFSELARMSQGSKVLHIAKIPGEYGVTTRHLLMVQGRPTHPVVLESGIIVSAKPAPFASMMDRAYLMRMLARWGTARNLDRFSAWTQNDLDDLLADLRAGSHRPGGKAVGATTRRYGVLSWGLPIA
ncbi:hypothetical protein SAMN05216282_13020 [Cryobacterium psychrotolerans]|uniref:Uncharacterized protein n=1 Tax=Cryobacterium psychrotolerans TaxID=386301 RepID=A0A1G9HEQ2_9MICO|nr:hypothetical protein [Cryobacterium psychrotolerans]TFD83249.1 hypothetical protein E3T56_13400 [Cryobacterium psychrotolerans]SDL11508.1 hypothetical protein SAMN05216282_13020 [Cryobacterium psychrotolerans]